VPAKHANEIRDVLVMNRSVHHLSYRKCVTTDEFHDGQQIEACIFSFMCVNKKTHELIDLLTMYGVSSRFGSLNVSALTSTKPRVATLKEVRREDTTASSSNLSKSSSKKKPRRKYKISDRLAYDEVYDTIDNQLHLTFDYLALIFVGGCIAGIGLLTNSAVAVVASMLVSPLMGPIVGMTFGAVIKDRVMLWKSFRNELIGVLVCFITGAFLGFITAPIMDTPRSDQLAFGVNTQISSRGEWIALAWGAGVAAPSGIGVALGVSSDQVSALIGVAISAALLPPIVNSGICLASAFVFFVNPKYDTEIVLTWWEIGYVSFLLFLLNWVLIFVFGLMTFRAKKLHQSANEQKRLADLNKFYDLKEKREREQQEQHSLQLDMSPKRTDTKRQKTAITPTGKEGSNKNGNNLRTPLLSSNSNAVNYSDDEGRAIDMKPKHKKSFTDLNSLDDDTVPAMLATFSSPPSSGAANGHNDEVAEMINWDKVQRTNRGMSDITMTQSMTNVVDNGMSKKRKAKKSSFDGKKAATDDNV